MPTGEANRPPPGNRVAGRERFLVLAAAVVIQLCLGGVYAWSAFATALRSDFGLNAARTQFVFGLAIATFTLSMVVGGRWIGRSGARRLALCAGLLFGAGHLVSAYSGGEFARILTGSGLLAGIGTGLGYVAALTTVSQWFPRHKGLAIGVTVAGFGAGAMVLSALASHLLHGGIPVLEVFRIVGVAYAAVIVLAGSLLFRAPPQEADPGERSAGKEPSLGRDGRPLIVGMFSGTFAGLLVIGNLVSMGLEGGLGLKVATAAIGCFAAGNTVGRVAWGWLADRYGYRTIPFSLLFLAIVLVGLYAAQDRAGLFLSAVFLTGFGFGANFVIYAAQVAARHGTRGLTRLYPKIFLAYGMAGITGPPIGGYIHDTRGSYGLAVGVAVALLLAAWKASSRGSPAPGYTG